MWRNSDKWRRGPCKVRNGTETKRNTTKRNEIRRNETKYVSWETKRNRICKLRNETKRNEIIQWIKKKIIPRRPRPFKLYVRVYLRIFFYLVIVDVFTVFYTYAIYFIWQKSCTFPNRNSKCIINQFNFIMIDGHIKILIWHCKLTKYSIWVH